MAKNLTPHRLVQQSAEGLAMASRLTTAILVGILLPVLALRSDQPPPDSVGAIDGGDIVVKGPVSIDVANGRSRTLVSNGSEVTVKSGPARLDLVEGGVIGICGPAHFSLLKASGTLTVALDYGSVHAQVQGAPNLTIFTPMLQASLVDIGGAPRDTTIGLETSGAMCIHTTSGAARIEQQLTGQSLLVPQGGELNLTAGQLDATFTSGGSCRCEIAVVKNNPTLPLRSAGLSALSPATEIHPRRPAPQPIYVAEERKDSVKIENRNVGGRASGPPAIEQPIYKVVMPPLTFDAASPAPPPDPSPGTILLVRTVRLRPTVVFRGRVEPAATKPVASAAPASTLAAQNPAQNAQSNVAKSENSPIFPKNTSATENQPKPTIMAKVRTFFHKLLSR
jgi:hypothetical protein